MEKNRLIWAAFYLVMFSIAAVIVVVLKAYDYSWWFALLTAGFFLAVALYVTISEAWTVVPEKYNYIVEIAGRYIGEPLKPGPHWLFPWMGLVEIRSSVYLGSQMMKLDLNENVTVGFGDGSVEFSDCSAPIKVFLYFSIFDPERSTYGIGDLFRAIEEKTDGLVRSYLGGYTLKEAIDMKNNFSVEVMATYCDLRSQDEAELARVAKAKTAWISSNYYTSLQEWGVKPSDVVISDFELPPDLEKARFTVMQIQKEQEVAEIKLKTADIEAKTAIVKAEADKSVKIISGEANRDYRRLDTEAEKDKVTALLAAGIPEEKIVELLVQDTKWEAVKTTANRVVIVGDAAGATATGVQAAAGFGAYQEKAGPEKERPNPEKVQAQTTVTVKTDIKKSAASGSAANPEENK